MLFGHVSNGQANVNDEYQGKKDSCGANGSTRGRPLRQVQPREVYQDRNKHEEEDEARSHPIPQKEHGCFCLESRRRGWD